MMDRQEVDPRFVARLGRKPESRNDIQCGYCGFKMAEIDMVEVAADPPEYDEDGKPRSYPERVLRFGPGVLPNRDDVWELTRHAINSAARGHKPRVRRQTTLAGLRRWVDGELRPTLTSRDLEIGQVPPKLPIRARCPSPRCGRVMLMDPDRLSVLAEPHVEWVGRDSHKQAPTFGRLSVSSHRLVTVFTPPEDVHNRID